jgi:chorismate dehydratase
VNTGNRRLSLIDSLEFQPLVYGLKNRLGAGNFELVYSDPLEPARHLRDGEVELGLIPSIDYARTKEVWNIVPDISISSSNSILNVQLFFKKGLKELKTVALNDQAGSAAFLLKILMQEKFMMNPEYLLMPVDLEQMLNRADAALVTGDRALDLYHQNQNRLDLNEEWFDLTGLPFVYSFWAGREFTITPDDLRILVKSFEVGKRNLENICKEHAISHDSGWAFYHDFLTKNVSYAFGEHEKAGLLEFYNYAFFFGFIDFIPDLHFYKL